MQTRQSTLTWGSRYFRNIFNGPFKPHGEQLFLDCCPESFAHVLHFLRHRRLRPFASLADVEDIAEMFTIDCLLDEIDRRKEIESLLGVWYYWSYIDGTQKEFYFTIGLSSETLWFQEAKAAEEAVNILAEGKCAVYQGEVKKKGGVYYVQEDWGTLRLERKGLGLMIGFTQTPGVELDSVKSQSVATRK